MKSWLTARAVGIAVWTPSLVYSNDANSIHGCLVAVYFRFMLRERLSGLSQIFAFDLSKESIMSKGFSLVLTGSTSLLSTSIDLGR